MNSVVISLWTKFYTNSTAYHAEYHEYKHMPVVGETIHCFGPYGVKQQYVVEHIEGSKQPTLILKRVYSC